MNDFNFFIPIDESSIEKASKEPIESRYDNILLEGVASDNMVFIYSLEYPEGNIRYIGKTINLKNRLSGHYDEIKYSNTYKSNWLKSLKKIGVKPIMNIIDIVEDINWQFWEKYYISLYRSWGFNLTNLAIGGEGGNLGLEVNKRISNSLKGKKLHQYVLDKMRDGRRSGSGNSNFGKHFNEESKNKMRETFKKNYRKENHPLFGVHPSEDTIRKQVESHLGHKRSVESINKQKESFKRNRELNSLK